MVRRVLPNSPELPQTGGYTAFVPRFYTLWRMLKNWADEVSVEINNIGGGTPGDPDRSVQFNDAGTFAGSTTASIDANSNLSIEAGGKITGDWYGGNVSIQNSNTADEGTYVSVIPRVVGTVPEYKVWYTLFSRPTQTDASYHQISIRNNYAMQVFGRGSSLSTDVPDALCAGYSPNGSDIQVFKVLFRSGNMLLTDYTSNTLASDPGYKLEVQGTLHTTGAATFDSRVDFAPLGRIRGDFTTSTFANVTSFQSTTTNGRTLVQAIPNGGSNVAGFIGLDSSAAVNAGYIAMYTVSGLGRIETCRIGSGTANDMAFLTGNTPTEAARIDTSQNVVIGTAAIATNAANGFLYIPGCAGTPTGTPTTKTGRVPLVVDTTNHKLYFYSGGAWRDAGP